MRNLLFLFPLTLFLTSCIGKLEDKALPQKSKSKFEMYQMSEMSLVMEKMFADNQKLRSEILEGKQLGEMPDYFQKIHSAVMTDPAENDDFYKAKAKAFLESQAQIYSDAPNAKQHFNESVTACIDCHKVKCMGPVSRIKKLYIK